MGKKKDEEKVEVKEEQPVNEPARMPVWKYLESVPQMNKYARSYVWGAYHGILKTESEWKKELTEKGYMEA